MFDQGNSRGRRIVEPAQTVPLTEVSKWNPLSGFKLARAAASGEHIMDSTRTARAIENGRTWRRYGDSQARAAAGQAKQAKQEATNAARMTPNGQTVGQRRAALDASRQARANGTGVGRMEANASNTMRADAHAQRMAQFNGMSLGQKVGFAAKEGWANASPKAKAIAGGTAAAAGGTALVASGRKKQEPSYDPYGFEKSASLADVAKAQRRFDPEADRQRRTGLYAGALAGGAVSAGTLAGVKGHFERVAEDAVESKGRRTPPLHGIKGSKAGYAAAAAAGLMGLGSAAAYKRGISHRNQPWT